MSSVRDVELELAVTPFGTNGMLMATSTQMPGLMVSGKGEDDLFDCLWPVLRSLFQAHGEHIELLTVDRSQTPIRVRAQVLSAQ